MADKNLIGNVVHFYDKIGVAVVKLGKPLKVGSKVKFVHGENNFEQSIDSMQLDHNQISQGEKGQEVAIKVDKETKSGTQVYLA